MAKGILFDLNGTLIDILTDEYQDNLYQFTAGFLSYSGVLISPEQLRERYFFFNREQRRKSPEEFPEFDAVRIFHDIILENIQLDETAAGQWAAAAARVFRTASMHKLEPYPGVAEILRQLKPDYRLAAVSDGQSAWALPELHRCQLDVFFESVTVSGDLGFRKPDRRIFETALNSLGLAPEEVIFVGNDMYRDICGAHDAGMKTVFFKSNQGDQSRRRVEPDYIIYDFRELPEALKFLHRQTTP